MTAANLLNELKWARSRLLKKGLEIGSAEFNRILRKRTAASPRKKVYESWADACLDALKAMDESADDAEAAKISAKRQHVLLAARDEFPDIESFCEGAAADKSSSLEVPPEALVLPGSKVAGTANSSAVHLAHAVEPMVPAKSEVLLRPQFKAEPADLVSQNTMGGSGEAGQHIPHIDTALKSAGLTVENQLAGGDALQSIQKVRAVESGTHDHWNSGQGGTKRDWTDALQASGHAAELGLKRFIRQPKALRSDAQDRPEAHEFATNFTVTAHSLCVNSGTAGVTAGMSQGAAAMQTTARADYIKASLDGTCGAAPEAAPEAAGPMQTLKPNEPKSLLPSERHVFTTGASTPSHPLQKVQPAATQGAPAQHPPQPLAEIPPVRHGYALGRPVPVQPANPIENSSTTESRGKHAVVQTAAMSLPRQAVAKLPVHEQSHVHRHGKGQFNSGPADRRLVSDSFVGVGEDPPITPAYDDERYAYVRDVKYSKLGLIGKGGSSKVFKVNAPNGKTFALKRVNLSCMTASARQGFREEVALLERLRGCPGIIKMYSFEEHPRDKMLYVVLEIGELDLHTLLWERQRRWTEMGITDPFMADSIYISYIWQAILRCVQQVHEAKIVHSDLKPANFLMVNGVVKLIDFGIAKTFGNNTTAVDCNGNGTYNYMAPEAVSGTGRVSRASDVWSLGCMLYQIAYNKLPFEHVTPLHRKVDAIIHGTIEFPLLSRSDVLDILKLCLQKDASKRPTIAELLKHEYLQASAGGQLVQTVMWEMHLAMLRAPLVSLGERDSHMLFEALQCKRNHGCDISADEILRQYLADRDAPQAPLPGSEPVDVIMPVQASSGQLTVPKEVPGEHSVTGEPHTLQTQSTAGEPSTQPRQHVGRRPLAENEATASTAGRTAAGLAGTPESHVAHTATSIAKPSSRSGQVEARSADVEGYLVQSENENVRQPVAGNGQNVSQHPRQVPSGPVAAHPDSLLEAKLQAMRDAHVNADEGYRQSLAPH
eukprot:jgi/Ulvmu1/4762/UM020_0047.1